jgi:hypothetical protein
MDKAINENGDIGMVFPQPIVKEVSVPGGFYVFEPRKNISFAWVKPEHVDSVLFIKGGCCGQNNKPAFRLATQSDANIWEGKSER